MRIKFIYILIITLLLAGCSSDQTFANDNEEIKIGYVPETMTVERWQRDRDIFVSKAKELGAEVIVKNAYEDSALQEQICMDMMIEEGVDVLVIIAYDKDSLGDVVKYAHNNNVKVIAYDRIIRNVNVDVYITFNNFQVGEFIGISITDNVPTGDYLILNGSKTDYNAFMFRDGYMSMIDPLVESGDINIVGETWIDAWRDELSYQFVSDIIAKGITFDAIVAANDRIAEGAIKALSENRIAGDIYVTGQDAELGACQRIVEGTQHMTVYKSINMLAQGAARIAVKLAQGDEIKTTNTINDGTFDINYIAYMPVSVTEENLLETVIRDGFFTREQIYTNSP